jgi:ATP-binding cassette subfamily B protein|nr:ABC transporter ATP-binding protein [uncultured Acetatifactor sp.]
MDGKKKKLQTIFRGIRLIESLSPHFMLCCIGQAVLKALSPFINIYLSAVMINSLLGGQSMEHMLALVLLMVALNLACQGLGVLMDRLVSVRQNVLSTQYHWALNKKMMEFSYADVESHAVQALREKIRQMEQVNNMGLWNLVFPVRTVIQSVFSILFAFSIFFSVFFQQGGGSSGSVLTDFFCSPWASAMLAVLILGNILVSLWTVSQSTKKVYDAYAGLVPLNQVYTYYLENYIDTYHSGKDIRLYHQGDLIRREMEHLLADGRMPMKRLKGIEFKYNGLGALAAFIMNVFIYLTVGMRTLAGLFSAGNIVQYIGGISQFITGFTTLSGQLTLLGANVEALDLLLQYLNIGREQEDRGQRDQGASCRLQPEELSEIRFRNVSFAYPDTDRKVLENLSFAIRAGEKLAVVGANGSGKTTMIKLLCRLYDVDEGEILINGVDIREVDRQAWQKLFGVVFQDFQLFPFGLGQNLAGSMEYDADRARAALEEAGFGARLGGMDMETAIYKDFDPSGVEISGGEAQKIAIARALYKHAPVLVLDEPTAALDPQAEYEVYKNLNHVSENRTAIFISHRMSSCRFCDRILVFDGGRLVQEGSHEELLGDENGKYYQLWRSQEQYYQ